MVEILELQPKNIEGNVQRQQNVLNSKLFECKPRKINLINTSKNFWDVIIFKKLDFRFENPTTSNFKTTIFFIKVIFIGKIVTLLIKWGTLLV